MEGQPPPTPPPQEPTPPTPPPEPAPPPGLPEDEARPATLAEVRTLRRWLAVAGVWAVAASAIAIIALLETQKDDTPSGPRNATASELDDVQKSLDNRIDQLESQIKNLPQANDVSKLNARLKKVEDQASDTRGDVKKLRSDLDDLSNKVDDVEQAQENAAANDTNTDTTETTP